MPLFAHIGKYDVKEKFPIQTSFTCTKMFSGASKVAPFVRYNFASFYYSGSVDELAAELQLKPAPSGANVWIFTPGDDGIYYGAQNVGDVPGVSYVQLYLDLMNFKGRGEEQAAAITAQLLDNPDRP